MLYPTLASIPEGKEDELNALVWELSNEISVSFGGPGKPPL